MIIPCDTIAKDLTNKLKANVSLLTSKGKQLKLLAVLAGDQPEQYSYVRIKQNLAHALGIGFESINFPNPPPFPEFLKLIQEKVAQTDTTGMILQLPLPKEYDQETLYESIPRVKEIEGHHSASSYVFPLVQACVIGLDWVFRSQNGLQKSCILPIWPDNDLISWLRTKQIVVAGRGMTTGKPVAAFFDKLHVPFKQTNSTTQDPDSMYRKADIIICGVGRRVITKSNIKKGVVLLNFGLHKETKEVHHTKKSFLVGDYDEEEVKDLASWYTITPGGLGPIDILCLYGNLIESATAQT